MVGIKKWRQKNTINAAIIDTVEMSADFIIFTRRDVNTDA